MLYSQKRNASNMNLKSYNSHEFYIPKDTGTGTNIKGMIFLDLAVLSLSPLPAIVHASLLFKNIDDEENDGIIKIYANVEKINKQVFIAFDKQRSYRDETYKILQNNKVHQLWENGGELYWKPSNREVVDETKL
ncbi:DUF2326 domain-containing protein [Mycoplasma corogypsi]|uniref:DUF2326 domain-containing protein n=1 Tax=Mycoplasma corogypsi TaxID=2106 RepID=UPI003872E9CC